MASSLRRLETLSSPNTTLRFLQNAASGSHGVPCKADRCVQQKAERAAFGEDRRNGAMGRRLGELIRSSAFGNTAH